MKKQSDLNDNYYQKSIDEQLNLLDNQSQQDERTAYFDPGYPSFSTLKDVQQYVN